DQVRPPHSRESSRPGRGADYRLAARGLRSVGSARRTTRRRGGPFTKEAGSRGQGDKGCPAAPQESGAEGNQAAEATNRVAALVESDLQEPRRCAAVSGEGLHQRQRKV